MKRYSEKEEEIIMSCLSDEEVAKKLNRTKEAIAAKRQRLRVLKRRIKTWTKEEEEFLRNNYNKMQDKEIAKVLGRPPNSILLKRLHLKLYKRSFKNEK